MTSEFDDQFSIDDMNFVPDHEARAQSFIQKVLELKRQGINLEISADIIDQQIDTSEEDVDDLASLMDIDIKFLEQSIQESAHFFEVNSINILSVRVEVYADEINEIQPIVDQVDQLALECHGTKNPDYNDILDTHRFEIPAEFADLIPQELMDQPRYIASRVYDFEANTD